MPFQNRRRELIESVDEDNDPANTGVNEEEMETNSQQFN
jgi:hypothetical protein